MRKLIAGAVIAGTIMLGASTGNAESPSYWTRYARTNGTAKVHVVRIKSACINAEDSAAHLRLISYHDGIAVYGCERVGY